jgi:hypothetical protein
MLRHFDHFESEQYLRYGNTLHQFQLRIFVSNVKYVDDKYKNCVILSLSTIIVFKLISNSYRGMGEVIDTDIMYVHRACFL